MNKFIIAFLLTGCFGLFMFFQNVATTGFGLVNYIGLSIIYMSTGGFVYEASRGRNYNN